MGYSPVGVTEQGLVEEELWCAAFMTDPLGVKFDSESV